MAVLPEPPLGTDSPHELVEHVTQFRDDWLVYLRNLTGYAAELEEKLFLEKDQYQKLQSQLTSQLATANGVIEFQKKSYKETLNKNTRKIIDLEKEKEKALITTIPTVITPNSIPPLSLIHI